MRGTTVINSLFCCACDWGGNCAGVLPFECVSSGNIKEEEASAKGQGVHGSAAPLPRIFLSLMVLLVEGIGSSQRG